MFQIRINNSNDNIHNNWRDSLITFLYIKEDWTAAELAMKVRGLAGSKNIKVYSTPKHGQRDDEQVFRKLKQTEYGIFLAYDQLQIDKTTLSELRFLKENKIPVYFIIPYQMKESISNLKFTRKTIYTYDLSNVDDLKRILNTLIAELTIAKSENSDFWDFLIILGLILLTLYLFSTPENQ